MKITLDYTKTLEQNASVYFDKAKKAKKKLVGLKEAMEITNKKLEKAEVEKTKAEQQAEIDMEISKHKAKKEWYEKFRWFHTSKGHLVIGGRDATTNEIVIKKHTDKEDAVFHTDMAGSPFFVVKLGEDSITDEEKEEVAQATASYSRAWSKGLGSSEVFCVSPEQVTKEAQAGESLPKGAFMIRGKTEYIRFDGMSVAIGFKDSKLIGGPVKSISPQTKTYIKIVQGDDKPGKIAKTIRSKLKGGDLDEIIRFLPAGNVGISK